MLEDCTMTFAAVLFFAAAAKSPLMQFLPNTWNCMQRPEVTITHTAFTSMRTGELDSDWDSDMERVRKARRYVTKVCTEYEYADGCIAPNYC
jgi:hypothetical protein